MGRLTIIIGLTAILFSCSKSQKAKDPVAICPDNTWLTQKQSELSNCTCLTAIYQATYLGQVVFEIRGIDPLCNGINVVYQSGGSVILNSGDPAKYQSYLASVQNMQLIWTCTKSK